MIDWSKAPHDATHAGLVQINATTAWQYWYKDVSPDGYSCAYAGVESPVWRDCVGDQPCYIKLYERPNFDWLWLNAPPCTDRFDDKYGHGWLCEDNGSFYTWCNDEWLLEDTPEVGRAWLEAIRKPLSPILINIRFGTRHFIMRRDLSVSFDVNEFHKRNRPQRWFKIYQREGNL